MSELLPKIPVLFAPGTNCEQETIDAVNLLGGQGERVLLSDLGRGYDLNQAQGLIIPGGFSFGDHLGSGNVFAQYMRTKFADQMNEFVESAKPILGICNGFQVLVRSGILPGGSIGPQTVTLTTNESNQFGHRWIRMATDRTAVCEWLPEDMPDEIELPVANKEGRFQAYEKEVTELAALGRIPLQYVDQSGEVTWGFPANPSGAVHGVAALCTKSVLGLMPHPERFVTPYQYDNWRRFDDPEQEIVPHGRFIIGGMIDYIKAA